MGAPLVATAPFGTVAQMSAYLRVEITPVDIVAQLALAAATSAIQSYTEQLIARVVDDVVTLDGTGTDHLLLPELPVISVAQVRIDVDTDSPSVLRPPSAGSQADYAVITRKGMLARSRGQFVVGAGAFATPFGTWPARPQSVEVTYTHGYEVIPRELQLLCSVIAARAFAQDGATQETVGTYVAAYAGQPGELTDVERRILDRYKPGRVD